MSWAEIQKQRQRLAREQGAIIKDWGGKLPFAIVYPNSYYLGMSNLGIHTIYRLLNSYGNIVAERAFWDGESKHQIPLAVESQRPLTDFAILAFSISYELDYFNVVQILRASGIPLYATERDEKHPLIIAGGPCIIANPMPLSPFFDCLCIGEAESLLPAMLLAISEGIGGERNELLKTLASLPGVFVPELAPSKPVIRQWARNLDEFPATSIVLTPDTELGDLYLIEVERGCHWSCRFCLACNAFRPIRFRSVDNLVAQAEEGLKYRKRLGLVGTDVADYPHIKKLLSRLHEMGARLSVSSLRIKPLSGFMLGELVRGGAKSIALAPEAGSERLRRVIRKGVSEKDILEAMEKVSQQGIKELKLYFMIGLPSETDEDVEAIIDLTLKCKDILDKGRTSCRLTLNVSPFVPKAGTPFQWLPMASLDVLNKRLKVLRDGLEPKGIKIKGESPAWSEVQAVLARGDVKLAEVLANTDEASLPSWRRAVTECGLDIDFYAHQQWETETALPWAIIDSGIKPERLKQELEKALVADMS